MNLGKLYHESKNWTQEYTSIYGLDTKRVETQEDLVEKYETQRSEQKDDCITYRKKITSSLRKSTSTLEYAKF